MNPILFAGALALLVVAVLIGSQLLGIIGVMMALPIAAAIPVVERIWVTEPRLARRAAEGAVGPPPGFT